MTEQALRKMIATGESTRQEFKSWVKCKDYRQRKELAVKSAVALANTKGGVLLFGVEDDGTITGCPKSDPPDCWKAKRLCALPRTAHRRSCRLKQKRKAYLYAGFCKQRASCNALPAGTPDHCPLSAFAAHGQ